MGRRTGAWVVVILALLSLSAGVRAAQSPLAAVDNCLSKLRPEADVGYARVSARCPELARRLAEGGWSVWLPRGWQQPDNDLSAGGLRELRSLMLAQPHEMLRSVNTDALPSVLASLGAPAEPPRGGWWERMKAWLRDVLERSPEGDGGWFSKLVAGQGLSQAVLETVAYVALALVVLSAVVIVVAELWVSGLVSRLRRRWIPFKPPLPAVIAAPVIGGVREPGVLLELIVRHLSQEGRLPRARGLTVRELTHMARFSNECDRERLAELAQVAETIRFSDAEVSSEAVARAVEGGRMLLQESGAT
jgi:hypothetical protein